jgi:hypothetical protein
MDGIKINGQEYAWGDLSFVALGRTLGGAIAVDYKAKKEKKALHAAGRDPRAIQHGKREYEGTLTVLQSELIALNRAARQKGFKDALDIEFDLIMAYLSPSGVITTDKVVKLSITELPSGMKEGDMNSEHALPFVALDVKYDIGN